MLSKPVLCTCEHFSMHSSSTSSTGKYPILLLNVSMVKFLHRQFLHQLNINITISVLTVDRIIGEISDSIAYLGTVEYKTCLSRLLVKRGKGHGCPFHDLNSEASLGKSWMELKVICEQDAIQI